MVRVKEKKAKGDGAFTKQKQKVGRKKLSPVTATRAEVHARTLRISTSSSINAQMHNDENNNNNNNTQAKQNSSKTGLDVALSMDIGGKKKGHSDDNNNNNIVFQSFNEALSSMGHYKTAQRASAFAAVGKILTNEDQERNRLYNALSNPNANQKRGRTEGGGDTSLQQQQEQLLMLSLLGGDDPMALLFYREQQEKKRQKQGEAEAAAAATKTRTTKTGATTTVANLSAGAQATSFQLKKELTPLEKLKTFHAALEALTDTEASVRASALHCLQIIIQHNWVCEAPRPSLGLYVKSDEGGEEADVLYDNVVIMEDAVPDNKNNNNNSNNYQEVNTANTNTNRTENDVYQEHILAILQSVHIALTHVMKSVRMAGIHLLQLLLFTLQQQQQQNKTETQFGGQRDGISEEAGPTEYRHELDGCLRQALLHMWHRQRSLLKFKSLDASIDMTAAQYNKTNAKYNNNNNNTQNNDAKSSDNNTAAREAELLEKEGESFLFSFVRRVSDLVLKTKYVVMMPTLIQMLLLLTQSQEEQQRLQQQQQQQQRNETQDGQQRQSSVYVLHTNNMYDFLETMLPTWSTAFVELMELQIRLLYQEDKLRYAACVAGSLSLVLLYLKKDMMASQVHHRNQSNHKVRFLAKAKQNQIKDVFLARLPVTIAELLKTNSNHRPSTSSNGSSSGGEGGGGGGGGQSNATARCMDGYKVRLAAALVHIAAVLSQTEEGYDMTQKFFDTVFVNYKTNNSYEQQLAVVHTFYDVLLLYPPSAVSVSSVASNKSNNSHNNNNDSVSSYVNYAQTMTEKLILYVPYVLGMVLQMLQGGGNSNSSSDNNNYNAKRKREEEGRAAQLHSLLPVFCSIMEEIAAFPVVLTSSTHKKVHQALYQSFVQLPKLLFSLRNIHDAHVLNGVVYRLLHVMWRMSSREHPLLSWAPPPVNSHGDGTSHSAAAASSSSSSSSSSSLLLKEKWKKELPSLFGLSLPESQGGAVIEGVLRRCTRAAVRQLAYHLLFYLGVAEAHKIQVLTSARMPPPPPPQTTAQAHEEQHEHEENKQEEREASETQKRAYVFPENTIRLILA